MQKKKVAHEGNDKVGDKGKYEYNLEEYQSEGEDLWAPDSDKPVYMKFKAFKVEDRHCPKFHLGQVFETVEFLRKEIKEYCCKNIFDVKLLVNDRKRVTTTCNADCI